MRILILIAVMFFTISCNAFYTPKYAFTSPYSDELIVLAEPYVTAIEIVPWRQMQDRYAEVTINGVVRIRDDQAGKHYQRAYRHELSHLYEYHILGLPWDDVRAHKKWTPYSAAR